MSRVDDEIEAELAKMLARHAAEGKLQSGATLKESVRIWEACTRAATTKLLKEYAELVQSRGKEWRKAMSSVAESVDAQHGGAAQLLSGPFRLATGGDGGVAIHGAMQLLDAAAVDIQEEVKAFADEWTAPRPKFWHERHPIIYALASAFVGAALGEVLRALSS